MKHAAAFVIACLVATAGADEFYLKHDASGTVYGPFSTDAGAKVTIGTTTFTVVRETVALSAVERKLDGIRIPQVDFRQAALQDAVEFLKMQTQRIDPERTGVNFVIAQRVPVRPDRRDDPFAGAGGFADRGPMVTLSLNDVSALQVLKTLMDLTGYSYKTSENTVTIGPKE